MEFADLWLWATALTLIGSYAWLAHIAVKANGSLGAIPMTRRLIHVGSMSWIVFYLSNLFRSDIGSHVQRVSWTRGSQFILIVAMVGLIQLNRRLRRENQLLKDKCAEFVKR